MQFLGGIALACKDLPINRNAITHRLLKFVAPALAIDEERIVEAEVRYQYVKLDVVTCKPAAKAKFFVDISSSDPLTKGCSASLTIETLPTAQADEIHITDVQPVTCLE